MMQATPNNSTAPIPEQTRELAKSLYIQGFPVPTIAQRVRLNVSTLRTWITRHKWKQTRDETRSILTQEGKEVPASAATITNTTKLVKIDSESDEVRKQLQDELKEMLAALRMEPVRAKDLPTVRGSQGRAAVVKTLAETAASIYPDWSDSSGGLVIVGEMRDSQDAMQPAIDVQASVSTPQHIGLAAQNAVDNADDNQAKLAQDAGNGQDA